MEPIPPVSLNKLTLVAEGFFAQVFIVNGSDNVVKIPNHDSQHLHNIEKRIYERIGYHPNILSYLGECKVEDDTESPRVGLCFAYQPGGTLREMLLRQDASSLLSSRRK
jgi:hypothetical protein